jgi:hypothetical protein
MKTFQEWAKERRLQERYGFEDDPAVESLDEEIYGIRETLKNMLSRNSLPGNWGDLGVRIKNLSKMAPQKSKEIHQASDLYDQLKAPIDKAYHQATSYGREDHPEVRELTNQAMKEAWGYFKPLVNILYSLGSGSMGM